MFNVTTSEYMINKASLQDNELRQLFFFFDTRILLVINRNETVKCMDGKRVRSKSIFQ